MDAWLLERLAAIAGLLLCAAFVSGGETAFFSMSRASRESLSALGDAASRRVLKLLSHPRRLIVTLIVCNETVNILGSSIAAAITVRYLPTMSQMAQVLIPAAAMVPLIMLVGEVTPKSIAIRLGERWARAVSLPLLVLYHVVGPL